MPTSPLRHSLRALLAGTVVLALAACGSDSVEGAGLEDDASDRTPAVEGRSLAAPPDLQVGEWWRMEVDPDLVDPTFEVTLVVTDVEDGRATLGIVPDGFSHHFLVLHVPPLGDLDLATMAWHVMWDDFEALRFPLEEGRTWEADFHGNDVTAEVTRVEGNRAWISYSGEDEIEAVYDADMGMITEFSEERLLLSFRVLEHGTGYEGPVRKMNQIRLGLMERGPDEPADEAAGHSGRRTATVEVDSGSSDGSISLVVWNRGFEDEPGRYRMVATAPDGTVLEETFETEVGSPSVIPASFGHDVVDGTWQIDFERDGPAGLLVELFTYDLVELELGAGGAVVARGR
jgi:hypothetical protein